jgi:hypothetical protein
MAHTEAVEARPAVNAPLTVSRPAQHQKPDAAVIPSGPSVVATSMRRWTHEEKWKREGLPSAENRDLVAPPP